MKPRAVIFDAYGTLFDVHSVAPAEMQALSRLWRQKQVEFTWRRALMQRYEDFWHVTEAALRSALAQLQMDADAVPIEPLMQAYLSPRAFGDVGATLAVLKSYPLAILSNGSPEMLEAAVRFNALEAHFAHVLSVDRIKTYKPAPAVYALGPEALGFSAPEILFVSSNAWDAAGAKAYGYTVCWCNRTGAAWDDLDFPPDFAVSRLDQIAPLF
jgi:2-haloacid dehalogenase